MFNTIKIIIIGILCLVIGGGIGWLINWGSTRIEIATLQSERDKAILEKTTIQLQWEKAVNELIQTKVLLNDTLAALELLKKYNLIDKKTKDEIKKIDITLDPQGNPTDDTYDEFRKLIENFNLLQKGTSSFSTNGLQPFIELRKDAEELLQKVTAMLIERRLNE